MAIQNVYLEASDRAKRMVKDNIVIDTLNCVGLFEDINWVDNPKASEVIYGYFDRAREAGITYLRSAQGVMQSIQFIEVIPSDKAVAAFDDVRALMGGDTNTGKGKGE